MHLLNKYCKHLNHPPKNFNRREFNTFKIEETYSPPTVASDTNVQSKTDFKMTLTPNLTLAIFLNVSVSETLSAKISLLMSLSKESALFEASGSKSKGERENYSMSDASVCAAGLVHIHKCITACR